MQFLVLDYDCVTDWDHLSRRLLFYPYSCSCTVHDLDDRPSLHCLLGSFGSSSSLEPLWLPWALQETWMTWLWRECLALFSLLWSPRIASFYGGLHWKRMHFIGFTICQCTVSKNATFQRITKYTKNIKFAPKNPWFLYFLDKNSWFLNFCAKK